MGHLVSSLEGIMSLPDYLLNDDEQYCEQCGAIISKRFHFLCGECRADLEDAYADEKIQDRLEGRKK